MFPLSAVIKYNGTLTTIQSGPDPTGLVFDLDAENAVGSPVTAWPDSSAHGNNGIITGAPIQTPSLINGYPAVITDGATSYITIPVTPTEPFTLFVVAKFISGSRAFAFNGAASWGGFGPGGNWGFFDGEGGPVVDLGVAANTWTLHEEELITAPPGPSGYDSSGVTRLNGGTLITINRAYTGGSETNLQIGAQGDGTAMGSVQVTRVIGFNKLLSTEVKLAWRTYLADRYGITLAP